MKTLHIDVLKVFGNANLLCEMYNVVDLDFVVAFVTVTLHSCYCSEHLHRAKTNNARVVQTLLITNLCMNLKMLCLWAVVTLSNPRLFT